MVMNSGKGSVKDMDMDMGRDSSVSQWHGLREHGICASFKTRYEQLKIWTPNEPRRHFLLSGFWFNERRPREDSRTCVQGRGRKDNCVVVRIAYCVNKCMRKSSCFVISADPCDD